MTVGSPQLEVIIFFVKPVTSNQLTSNQLTSKQAT